MLKLALTDGVTSVDAVEMTVMAQLDDVECGSKVAGLRRDRQALMRAQLLIKQAEVRRGILLLQPQDVVVVGGRVPEYAERNDLAATLRRLLRCARSPARAAPTGAVRAGWTTAVRPGRLHDPDSRPTARRRSCSRKRWTRCVYRLPSGRAQRDGGLMSLPQAGILDDALISALMTDPMEPAVDGDGDGDGDEGSPPPPPSAAAPAEGERGQEQAPKDDAAPAGAAKRSAPRAAPPSQPKRARKPPAPKMVEGLAQLTLPSAAPVLIKLTIETLLGKLEYELGHFELHIAVTDGARRAEVVLADAVRARSRAGAGGPGWLAQADPQFLAEVLQLTAAEFRQLSKLERSRVSRAAATRSWGLGRCDAAALAHRSATSG
jgi:hypothetical protein